MAAVTTLAAPDVMAAKRLVIKIGSALLVDRKTGLKQGWLSALAMDVAEAKVRGADVVLQNFRPGVMDRLGFGYQAVRAINPKVVYGSVTGYGTEGPWVDLPGQDLLAQARAELDRRGKVHGPVQVGAMIEVPAAALSLPLFLRHFDFLSIGTNDLIQYTLAIDRADESVAHLYDPLHPAVLRLVADTIAACRAQGKGVSVCGEMAGDVTMTKLLLGLGLRSFSMHPSQVLAVKQRILLSHADKLKPWAEQVLESDDPATLMPR